MPRRPIRRPLRLALAAIPAIAAVVLASFAYGATGLQSAVAGLLSLCGGFGP